MIRAHVPPFDTVSPTYTRPEKKVEQSTCSGEAELTYKDTSNRKQQNDSQHTIANSRISPSQTVPAPKTFSEKSYLQEVLLAILQNPMTDINNLTANINAARWYAAQVSENTNQ